jgi:hypothetical protein
MGTNTIVFTNWPERGSDFITGTTLALRTAPFLAPSASPAQMPAGTRSTDTRMTYKQKRMFCFNLLYTRNLFVFKHFIRKWRDATIFS